MARLAALIGGAQCYTEEAPAHEPLPGSAQASKLFSLPEKTGYAHAINVVADRPPESPVPEDPGWRTVKPKTGNSKTSKEKAATPQEGGDDPPPSTSSFVTSC